MKPFSLALTCLTLLTHVLLYADAIGYDEGPCLEEAYNLAGGTTGATLGCTANDVTPTLRGWDGPTTCIRGEYILVNITSDINFKSSTSDFFSYTSLSSPNALNGESCAMATFGPEDAAISSGSVTGGAGDPVDTDSCYDVNGKYTVTNYSFRKNLRIRCTNSGAATGVDVNNCYSWGPRTDCDAVGYGVPNPRSVSYQPR